MSHHILLIDAHAVLHRAYHAIPKLSVNGQPVNAIYGFYSALISALDQLNPTHLSVCLDSPGPTFRNQQYLAYRTQRKKPDQDLLDQLPRLPDTLAQANIDHHALSGYEADDLIATLANKYGHKFKVTIITADKDLMQLVTKNIRLFMPQRGLSAGKIFGPRAVKAKLGVAPSQVVDLKGLMGDPSDNYPGVSGVGPKTAQLLLDQFKTLDNLYKNLDQVEKDNLQKKLITDKDNAYLSKKLAQLVDNVPIKFKLKNMHWSSKKAQSLLPLFDSFNFRSLTSRLTKLYPALDPKPVKKNSNQTSLF